MSLFALFARKFAPGLLAGTVLLCTALALPVLADTPPTAAPHTQTHIQPRSQTRIQIQCTAVRARYQDVDALGINFILMPSERVSANGIAQKNTGPPRFAVLTRGPDASRMLRFLTQRPPFLVKTLTTANGHPATFSLAGLHDPGMTVHSRLSVTPERHADGTLTLSVMPQFNFMILPGHGNPAAPVTVKAFPVHYTLSNGGTMVFTLFPKPKPAPHFGQVFPTLPAPGQTQNEDQNETRLWIFLSATLLPSEKGDR